MDVTICQLSPQEVIQKGIDSWPVWTKEPSLFDWKYDSKECCLILEGEAEITTAIGVYTIKAGDFVVFENGLKCTWKVKKNIKKHYKFE
jgi:uncharacterized cupin superfamily protein